MTATSKELIFRMHGAEQAFARLYLSTVASEVGNPRQAGFEDMPWGMIAHLSARPGNTVFNRATASGDGMLAGIDAIEARFAARHVPSTIEVSAVMLEMPEGPEQFSELVERGYKVCDIAGIFFASTADRFASPAGTVEVVEIPGDGDVQTFLDVYLGAWGYPDDYRPVWKEIAPAHWDDPKFSAYLALVEGRPAGTAQLYVHDGIGYFADACVLEAERRQGCQTALFEARLRAARDAGCEHVFSIAELGGQSARNMQNFGLHLASELWNWRKAP